MPLIELDHITLEFAEYGSPECTPLLLLHGFPDAAASWHALIEAWHGPPVRFLAPSQRGYGQSRVTDPLAQTGEVASLADDAILLLEALGIERAVWVGHDWGARAAYAAAVLAPERVRALVGLASEYVAYRNTGDLPFPQARDYWYQWFFHTAQGERALTRDRKGLCRYLWQIWSPGWHFAEEELDEAAPAWNSDGFVPTVLSYYRTRNGNAPGVARYAAQSERLAAKPHVAAPTWFVTGLADACNHSAGSRGQEQWFGGGYQRIELEGIGHFVHREASGDVVRVLEQAIESTH